MARVSPTLLTRRLVPGHAWGTLTKGQAVAEAYNALGYDFISLGNHEFDFGADTVRGLVKAFKAPVLNCNIYDKKTGKRVDFVKPWAVKDVAGVKIGVFGLLTTRMAGLVLPKQVEGLEFRREIDEAKAAVAALKKEGATVIIALSHVGFESPDKAPFEGDQSIAASVPGIDVIVGGHTHTILRDAVRDATYGTLIVQAGSNLAAAGRTLLEIDPKTGKVVKSEDRMVDLWVDEFGEAAKLKAIVDKYREVGNALEVVVYCGLAIPITATGRVPMGGWMTDYERTGPRRTSPSRTSAGSGPPTALDRLRSGIFSMSPLREHDGQPDHGRLRCGIS